MIRSKLAVLCLCTASVTLYVSNFTGTQKTPGSATSFQIPGLGDFQRQEEMPAVDASAPALANATGIRTYFGGYGHSIFPVAGGGAMMAGTFGAGGPECCKPWLVRLNAVGTPLWQLLYEADGLGGANNMQQTSDGGYIFAGEGIDLLAVKVDVEGNVEWSKNYGEGGYTYGRVFITSEDDYLLLGGTKLEDDGFHSNGRVLRLDQDGNILWQKIIGQYGVSEYFTSATVSHDGNMVVAGMNAGDYWALELDLYGNIVWEKTYGGPLEDDAWTITRFRDNFYIVVGSSDSFAQGGLRNWWAILISNSGQLVAQRSYGGPDAEDPNVVIATSDGGAMIGGGTGSFGAGFSDIWLIKFDWRGRIQWQKTYGVDRTDHAWHIQELSSGGYIVIGDSYLYPGEYDFWLMVIDEYGNVRYGECGEVGDTFVSPIPTNATVQTPSTPVIDREIEATDLLVDVVEQPLPIEDCTPGYE